MKYDALIVGLGNPGAKYARTRHNFGFMLVDSLLAHWGGQSNTSCAMAKAKIAAELWDIAEDHGARRWLVVKPQTFMNLSGQAVGELCRKNGIGADRVLVLHDELDLPLGTARFKFSGGLAGHNGLKSIAAHLGTRDFSRLRLGIGRPLDSTQVVDYVLRGFLPDEWDRVRAVVDGATEAVLDFCSLGLAAATERLHSRG
jgi:PTH1 family peptidyl-tRNA hydrolase